jgi:hypothetical protein
MCYANLPWAKWKELVEKEVNDRDNNWIRYITVEEDNLDSTAQFVITEAMMIKEYHNVKAKLAKCAEILDNEEVNDRDNNWIRYITV